MEFGKAMVTHVQKHTKHLLFGSKEWAHFNIHYLNNKSKCLAPHLELHIEPFSSFDSYIFKSSVYMYHLCICTFLYGVREIGGIYIFSLVE